MDFLTDEPDHAVPGGPTLALAHGAGAGMDTPFMNTVAKGLARRGLPVVRFEFPYMKRRRTDGRRRPPDPMHVLQATWSQAIAAIGHEHLVVGGKSMGGRIASMVADRARVRGLVCLGYPFHPPGKSERTRIAHLKTLETPTLIVQGTRDPFGKPDDVDKYLLSGAIRMVWIEDGDHSFKPPARSSRTLEQNLESLIAAVYEFVMEVGSAP